MSPARPPSDRLHLQLLQARPSSFRRLIMLYRGRGESVYRCDGERRGEVRRSSSLVAPQVSIEATWRAGQASSNRGSANRRGRRAGPGPGDVNRNRLPSPPRLSAREGRRRDGRTRALSPRRKLRSHFASAPLPTAPAPAGRDRTRVVSRRPWDAGRPGTYVFLAALRSARISSACFSVSTFL